MRGWMMLLVAAMASSAMYVGAQDAPKLNCDVGPVTKKYGGTDWLVYSCDDQKSLVMVTVPDSPASPFYFFYAYSDKSYHLYGEGAGDKQVTDKAYEDLKRLSEGQLAALLEETRKAAVHK